VIPRIITAEDWAYLEKGLTQRVTAINKFLLTFITIRPSSKSG